MAFKYTTNTSRLGSDNYQKTGRSYTEKLSDQDVMKYLENYVEVEDINKVPLNVHVRYFAWDKYDKRMKFRLGGFLKRNDDPRYVVFSNDPNGGKTWSVQTNSNTKRPTAFYRLKSKVEKEIEEKTEEATELSKKYHKELKEKQKELDQVTSKLYKKL